MQRLKEERFMVVAGLLKRQRNECGRNRVLSIADRYRSIGCCFQLLYLLSGTAIGRKQEKGGFDNAFYKDGFKSLSPESYNPAECNCGG